MSIFALVYRAWPALADSVLAKLHFILYAIAHLVQMVLLYVVMTGKEAAEPALGIASIVVGIAVLLFGINVWKNAGAEG